MRSGLMHRLITVSECLFEDMTDELRDKEDLGRRFWSYLRANTLNDARKKIKVSDYVHDEILKIDCDDFEARYGLNLRNVKKSAEQMQFVCTCVTMMLRHSEKGAHMIDWS